MERGDPSGWPAHEREIYQALAEFQRQGYTVAGGDASTGDASPPIPTACVPLRTRDGAAVFGLSCSAPAFPPAEDRLVAELGPRLVELAGRVRQGGPAL